MDASLRNRREAGVVDWLIDRLALRLADRTAIRHRPPWEPRANVLLGVLEPIWVQPPQSSKAIGEDPPLTQRAGGSLSNKLRL